MDLLTIKRAVKKAKRYTDSVALGQGAVQIQGPPGDNVYQLAVKNGFTGTEKEYLESLKGTAVQSISNAEIQSIFDNL